MQPFRCRLPQVLQLPLQHHTYYETPTHLYVVSTNRLREFFVVLKFDKDAERLIYSLESEKLTPSMLEAKINMISSSSKMISHGFSCGIIGFVRFLKGYYCILATKKKRVGRIGPHIIYEVQDTVMIPLFVVASSIGTTIVTGLSSVLPARSDEQRYVEMFRNNDLKRHFYFSFSYDLSNMLQTNMSYTESAQKNSRSEAQQQVFTGTPVLAPYRGKFIWNEFLLEPLKGFAPASPQTPRCPPMSEGQIGSSSVLTEIHPANPVFPAAILLIHGAVVHSHIFGFAGTVNVTLIARVSKNFAGSRYLKRGLDDWGHVAVHVELEQIVCDTATLTESGSCGTFSSFVQMRGSVPLKWHHPTRKPAPAIRLGPIDPTFSATKRHFAELFEDYGAPIYIINLLKNFERKRRELVISEEYHRAVQHMKTQLPPNLLHYVQFDIRNTTHRAWNEVTSIAEECLKDIGFFACTGTDARFQSGVPRSNCVDCIDRTNIAQYLVGLHVLGLQLVECRVLRDANDMSRVPEARRLLLQMYLLVGDALAIQYGGSAAVGAGLLDRGIGWDSLMNARRLFNNMQSVAQQEMTNLFLGIYRPCLPRGEISDFHVPQWEPPEGRLASFLSSKDTIPTDTVRLADISALDSDYYLHVRTIPPPAPDSGWWVDALANNDKLRKGMRGCRPQMRIGRPLTTAPPDHLQLYLLLRHDVTTEGMTYYVDSDEEDGIAGIQIALQSFQESPPVRKHYKSWAPPATSAAPTAKVASCYITQEPFESCGAGMPDMPLYGEKEEMKYNMNSYAEEVAKSEFSRIAHKFRNLELSDESDRCALVAVLSALPPPEEWKFDDLMHAMVRCDIPQQAREAFMTYIEEHSMGDVLQLRAYVRSERHLSPFRRGGMHTPSSRLGAAAVYFGVRWPPILQFLQAIAECPTADVTMYEEYASEDELPRQARKWEEEDLQETPDLARKEAICDSLVEHTDRSVNVENVDSVILEWLGTMLHPTTGVCGAARIRYVEGEQLTSAKMTPTAFLLEKCVTAKDLITWVVENASNLQLRLDQCTDPKEKRTMARAFLRIFVIGGLLHYVEHPTLLRGIAYGRDTVNTEVMDDRSLYRFFHWDPNIILNGVQTCPKTAEDDNEFLLHPTEFGETLANIAFQLHADMLEQRGEKTPQNALEELSRLSSYLQSFDLMCMNPEEQVCFFANVFNALYIQAWFHSLLHPVVEYSVLFNTSVYNVGGHFLSLPDIKHGILRQNRRGPHMLLPQFQVGDPRLGLAAQEFEPRIVLALVDLYVLPENKTLSEYSDAERAGQPLSESFAFVENPMRTPTPSQMLDHDLDQNAQFENSDYESEEDEFTPAPREPVKSSLWKMMWKPQSPSAPPHLCCTLVVGQLHDQLATIETAFASQTHDAALLPAATAIRRIQFLVGMEEFGRTREEVSRHFASVKRQLKRAASRLRDDMKLMHSPPNLHSSF